MQSFRSDGRSEPIPRGGSVSPLEKYTQRIFALIGEQPDLTLNEIVCALRKRRSQTSRSALSRFFARHDITVKKKAYRQQSASGPTWPGRGGAGYASKDV
jgi:transposase